MAEIGGALDQRGDAQGGRLVEGAADHLQPERQPVRRQAGRHRHRRQAGEIGRNGEDVVHVHFEWIALLADREGGPRRGRRQQRVDPLEGAGEIARDQGPHLLRLAVVGVVIAGRQYIGADQDAPAHLGAEAGGAGRFVHLVEALAFDPEPETDAVIAREVRGGFGWGDDVIGR